MAILISTVKFLTKNLQELEFYSFKTYRQYFISEITQFLKK